jgi:hypothetical protein
LKLRDDERPEAACAVQVLGFWFWDFVHAQTLAVSAGDCELKNLTQH